MFKTIDELRYMVQQYIDSDGFKLSHYNRVTGYIDCLIEIYPYYKDELTVMKNIIRQEIMKQGAE